MDLETEGNAQNKSFLYIIGEPGEEMVNSASVLKGREFRRTFHRELNLDQYQWKC